MATTLEMTTAEAAAQLNGSEYREEGSRDLWAQMRSAGLVAVFGASDDLMELRGAIDDERYPGDEPEMVTGAGLFQSKCECEDCPYDAAERAKGVAIKAIWDDGSGFSWRYETAIPHHKFIVNEDGEPYCEGIVFALADVPR